MVGRTRAPSRILGQVGPTEVCCDSLSQRQCSILRTLVAQEGARISDLAQFRISPSAMNAVLEKLEARKLVEARARRQADGRTATVKITAAGRKVRQQLDRTDARTHGARSSIPFPKATRAGSRVDETAQR